MSNCEVIPFWHLASNKIYKYLGGSSNDNGIFMKFKLFHTPPVRKFDHKPIYFNAEQEAREARKREVLGDNYKPSTELTADHTLRIKGSMRAKHKVYSEVAKRENKTSNWRLVLIILLLMAIAYYFYASSGEWLNMIFYK